MFWSESQVKLLFVLVVFWACKFVFENENSFGTKAFPIIVLISDSKLWFIDVGISFQRPESFALFHSYSNTFPYFTPTFHFLPATILHLVIFYATKTTTMKICRCFEKFWLLFKPVKILFCGLFIKWQNLWPGVSNKWDHSELVYHFQKED